MRDDHLNVFSMERYQRQGYEDIENTLAAALGDMCPLIALGKPGEHQGAGRAQVDDTVWRERIVDLLRRPPILIFVLPSSNSGTLEEIELIVHERHLNRTVFIMPPSDGYTFRADFDPVAKWKEAQEACHRFQIFLPQHRATGGLFQLHHTGQIKKFCPLPVPDIEQWRGAIQAIVDN